jgi:Tfp pilus assembly protein PilX
MNTNKKNNFPSAAGCSRGFTLLFAILVGSLLVGIGIAITNLALKQLSISSLGRESQLAFYAADSGAECALYWDIHGADSNHSGKPFYFASPANSSVVGTMLCGVSIAKPPTAPSGCVSGNQVTVCSGTDANGDGYTSNSFEVDYGSPSPCALILVKKYDGRNVVESNGINDCTLTNNPYRVERSIRVEYR